MAPPKTVQPVVDVDRMITDLANMRTRFDMLSQAQPPPPRQEFEAMRAQLQRMSGDLDQQVRRFPNQDQDRVRIARSYMNGLIADLDHMLNYQIPAPPPAQQAPQQQAPRGHGSPVPIRVVAPPRRMTYDVVIGPLPNQHFTLTLPPGETIQSLYAAAVQRGQVVDREFQAGALTLDGRPAQPQSISGQIPPTEANATTQQQMLSLLLLHNCFSLPPSRAAAGGDYTGGGGGHIAGFDVASVGPVAPGMSPPAPLPPRNARLDQFRDQYLAQSQAGAPITVALAPQPPAPIIRQRRRRG